MNPQCRLLVVDDEEGIRYLIRRTAEVAGFDVCEAGTVQAAVQLAWSWKPTCVILDLNIPGSDTREMMAELAAYQADIKLIVMTGADAHTLAYYKKESENLGIEVVGTLPKPWRYAQLRDLLMAVQGNQH